MSNNTLTGKVIHIGETQFWDSGFSKRETVIEVEDGKYKQPIKVEFIKDGIKLIEGVKVGDTVEVAINIRGNENGGKYYVSIQGWKVKKQGEAPAAQPEQEDDGDDLDDAPF